MRKYKSFIQNDNNTCAMYTALSILDYYGIKSDATVIKRKMKIGRGGTSIFEFIKLMEMYRICAKAYRIEDNNISDFDYPYVLLTNSEDNLVHFISVLGYRNDKYIVNDPNFGILRLTRGEMVSRFLGIIIDTKLDVYQENDNIEEFGSFYLNIIRKYKGKLLPIYILSGVIILINLVASIYSSLLIRSISNKSVTGVVAISIGFIIIMLFQKSIEIFKRKRESELRYEIDESVTFKSIYSFLTSNINLNDYLMDNSKLYNYLSLDQFESKLIEFFTNFFISVSSLLIYCLVLLLFDTSLLILYLLFFLIELLFVLNGIDKLAMKSRILFYSQTKVNNIIQYFISNLWSIRKNSLHDVVFNNYIFLKEDFNAKRYSNELKLSKWIILLNCTIQFFYYAILLFIALNTISSGLNIERIVFSLMVCQLLLSANTEVVMSIIEFTNLKNYFEIYKDTLYKNDSRGKIILEEKIQRIKFDDLSFGYVNKPLLFSHFDYNIEENMLISGMSGIGKTSLFSLLFDDNYPYKGNILINDIELRNIETDSLYKKICFINSTPDLIDGTILYNIFLDLEIDLEKLKYILHFLNLESFEEILSNSILANSVAISTGQIQVIKILRMLVHNYDVYILDEATANIDSITRKLIYQYIEEHLRDKIVIVISHNNDVEAFIDCRFELCGDRFIKVVRK